MNAPARPSSQEDLGAAYRALRKNLLTYLRKQVGDDANAEDLLHQVFLKALTASKQGRTPANLGGWLFAIARNAIIDHYRARRPTEELPDDLAAELPEDDAASKAMSACLRPLAEQLPAMYRDTVVATEFQGKAMRTLAAESNVSISAIKSRASRGRRMLKDRLLACCQLDLSRSGGVSDCQPRDESACGPSCGCA